MTGDDDLMMSGLSTGSHGMPTTITVDDVLAARRKFVEQHPMPRVFVEDKHVPLTVERDGVAVPVLCWRVDLGPLRVHPDRMPEFRRLIGDVEVEWDRQILGTFVDADDEEEDGAVR